jgi:hypothetical protein
LLAAIATAAHGTRKLDTDHLMSMPIRIPDPDSHERFVRWFQEARQIIERATATGPKIEGLFDVLLHRAFTADLTAKWREKHTKKLEAELQMQQKALAESKAGKPTRRRKARAQ